MNLFLVLLCTVSAVVSAKDAYYGKKCVFPLEYFGKTYTSCTTYYHGSPPTKVPWCSIVKHYRVGQRSDWEYCCPDVSSCKLDCSKLGGFSKDKHACKECRCVEKPKPKVKPCEGSSNPCGDGVCTDTGKGYAVCSCSKGEAFDASSHSCKKVPVPKVDPCKGAANPCGNGICTDSKKGYAICSCHDGQQFQDGSCKKIDPCANNVCGSAKCTSMTPKTAYKCSCKNGATYNAAKKSCNAVPGHGNILIVGGRLSYSTVEIASTIPGSNCNTKIGDYPHGVYAATGQIVDGEPMICGGWPAQYDKSCYRFNSNTKTWKTMPSTHHIHAWGGSAMTPRGFFMIGTYGQRYTEFFKSGSWTDGPQVPVAPYASVHRTCAVQLDTDRTMLIGGSIYGLGTTAKTWIYSSSSNSWSDGPSMNVPKYDQACAVMEDGRVIVTGGTSPTLTEIFDPKTNKWTKQVANPVNFDQAYIVIVGGVPTIVGGDAPSYTGVYQWKDNKWNKLAVTLKEKRAKHVAFTLSSTIKC